jgi:hypothetical protein
MSVTLLHKRSSELGLAPSISSLEFGELAINTYDGKLFIKVNDGSTDRIVSFTSGTSPLSISELDANNQVVAGTTVSQVTSLTFDQESGFAVDDLGDGAVKVRLNSTFKFWHVEGQETIVADGLDNIQLKAGNGIILTTDTTENPYKSITIATPPKTVQLFQDGILENTLGTVRWYAPGNITMNEVAVRIADLADVNIQVTIKKTGTGAESLTLTTGNSKVTKATNFSMGTDDFLTVDIIASNNTTGKGLSVEFFYTFN